MKIDYGYVISTAIIITTLIIIAIAVSSCAPACGRGGPCISPAGAQALLGVIQSGALTYHPEPITYYPEMYVPQTLQFEFLVQ